MKRIAILIAVVAIAGCVSSPQASDIEVQIGDEWIKPYQTTDATIIFRNNDENEYRDVKLQLVDDGILDGKCDGSTPSLPPGDVMFGYCSFKAGDVTGDAEIKYSIGFSSTLELVVPDIEVISEAEWRRREYKGKEERTISRSISDRNVRLDADLVAPVPLVEGKGTVLRIRIYNAGRGYVDKLAPGSLYVSDPYGIIERCYSMERRGNAFVLSEELPPISGNFQEIDCYVNPKIGESNEDLNIYNVKIHLDYNYKIMDTFGLRVIE